MNTRPTRNGNGRFAYHSPTKKPHITVGQLFEFMASQTKRAAFRLPSPIQTILSALEFHQINHINN